MDIDEDALWRAVASICGSLTALGEMLKQPNAKTKGEVDLMGSGLGYADVWLNFIDPFGIEDDEGVKLTLEK